MFLYLVGHKALRQFGEIDPLVLMIFPAIVEGVIEVEPIDQENDSTHENGKLRCRTKLNPAPLGGWGQQFGLAPNLTGMIYPQCYGRHCPLSTGGHTLVGRSG